MIHLFFFFNDTATTEIYTLSLHDALPISQLGVVITRGGEIVLCRDIDSDRVPVLGDEARRIEGRPVRSEEHTSELQSRPHLVCRLLLEKKKERICRTPPCPRPLPGSAHCL